MCLFWSHFKKKKVKVSNKFKFLVQKQNERSTRENFVDFAIALIREDLFEIKIVEMVDKHVISCITVTTCEMLKKIS